MKIAILLLAVGAVWTVWRAAPPPPVPLTAHERYCMLEQHLANLEIARVLTGDNLALQAKRKYAQAQQKTISESRLSCAGVTIDDARLPAGSKLR